MQQVQLNEIFTIGIRVSQIANLIIKTTEETITDQELKFKLLEEIALLEKNIQKLTAIIDTVS